MILGSSYGDENEIQYFNKKLLLGQNIGFSKKMTSTLEKSVSSRSYSCNNNRDHYAFSDYQTA